MNGDGVTASSAPIGAAGLSGSPGGIRVTVVGTNISTMTNGSGHFVLSGLPAGSVTLRFEGPGVDATVVISGLADGQVLTVTVHVAGATVVVNPAPSASPSPSASPTPRPSPSPSPSASPSPSPSPRPSPTPMPSPSPSPSPRSERVEFHGRVESVDASSLRVSGRTVMVDGNTRIRHLLHSIELGDLEVGDTVEVEGMQRSDGTVLAAEIELEHENRDVDLSGRLESVQGFVLRVAGTTVVTTLGTDVMRSGRRVFLNELRTGQMVTVHGLRLHDGHVLALTIEIQG